MTRAETFLRFSLTVPLFPALFPGTSGVICAATFCSFGNDQRHDKCRGREPPASIPQNLHPPLRECQVSHFSFELRIKPNRKIFKLNPKRDYLCIFLYQFRSNKSLLRAVSKTTSPPSAFIYIFAFEINELRCISALFDYPYRHKAALIGFEHT